VLEFERDVSAPRLRKWKVGCTPRDEIGGEVGDVRVYCTASTQDTTGIWWGRNGGVFWLKLVAIELI
jgi:hypothetical protein